MSDNQDPESTPAPESPVLPTPTISETPAVQPPSSGKLELDDATVEKLLTHPKATEILARQFQSAKDRRISKLEQAVADLKAGKATPQQVQAAVAELDEQLSDVTPGRVTNGQRGGGKVDTETFTRLARDYGIDPTDPALAQLATARPYASMDDLELAVARLKRSTQGSAQATPGTVVVDGGGKSPPVQNRDAKLAQAQTKLKALMAQTGRKDWDTIGKLREEIRTLLPH